MLHDLVLEITCMLVALVPMPFAEVDPHFLSDAIFLARLIDVPVVHFGLGRQKCYLREKEISSRDDLDDRHAVFVAFGVSAAYGCELPLKQAVSTLSAGTHPAKNVPILAHLANVWLSTVPDSKAYIWEVTAGKSLTADPPEQMLPSTNSHSKLTSCSLELFVCH